MDRVIPQENSAPTRNARGAGLTFRPTDLFWLVGLVLLVVGAAGMWQRITVGLLPTNLTSFVPWGLWVAFYDYLVWVEVGSLMVFTVLVYLAGQKRLEKLKPVVLLSGFAVLVMGLLLVMLDLGHPLRFWHVLVYPDFTSMIAWMVWLHMGYVLIVVAELALVLWGGARAHGTLKALAYLSLPVGLALIIVSGSIFGVVAARPLWNTASLPLMFLVSALASGSSLILLLAVLFWPNKKADEYRQVIRQLSRLSSGLILGGVFAAGVIAFTILYSSSGNPARLEALNLILSGPYWWSFWIIHILLGVAVPVVLLFFAKGRPLVAGIAAALNVTTFVAVTLNVVIPALVTPEIEGLTNAFVDPKLNPQYLPNLMEWQVIAFVFGLGAVVYGLGHRFLPIQREHAEVNHE